MYKKGAKVGLPAITPIILIIMNIIIGGNNQGLDISVFQINFNKSSIIISNNLILLIIKL